MRIDSDGRNVTDLPGLWNCNDYEIIATNYSHPSITSGQHTNGPATIWFRKDGGEWVNSGEKYMYKVIQNLTRGTK